MPSSTSAHSSAPSSPDTSSARDPGRRLAASNPRSRVIVASLVGTSIEFYDFYAYATAAVLVFPALFFPSDNPTASLLGSFAAFGVAFIARPIGAIVFGHFGDRIGRKRTLVASLLTMGIATILIGCLPTALTPGWGVIAPALLVLMRFTQGLGLGGEWSGAVLLATENAPTGRRAIYGTFPQLGAPIGFIIANTVFLILSVTLPADAFLAWGWRVPFLASAMLVIVGLYVRFRLVETPAFRRVVVSGEVAALPVARVFRTSWRNLTLGTFVMIATYTLVYLLTTFTLSYGTTATSVEGAQAAAEAAGRPFSPVGFVPGLGYARNDFLIMLIVGVVFFGIFTLVSGPLAERFGRRAHLIVVTVGILIFGLLFVPLFAGGIVGVNALLIIGFSLMGLTFGPMGALLPELFPTNVRYTGSAISYNVASILGAAVAPLIAVALWQAAGGSTFFVGLYLSAMAAITLVALLLSTETRDLDYADRVS